jgi:hypothetical protein
MQSPCRCTFGQQLGYPLPLGIRNPVHSATSAKIQLDPDGGVAMIP